jgi:hypothetical protein
VSDAICMETTQMIEPAELADHTGRDAVMVEAAAGALTPRRPTFPSS